MPERAGRWRAGQVAECEANDALTDHGVAGLHVVVRCECGAAFMSTDATIALSMAEVHASRGAGATKDRPDPTPTNSSRTSTAMTGATSTATCACVGPDS